MNEIEALIKHRDNLKNAVTWEEYRDSHVAFVQMLIEQGRAEEEKLFEAAKAIVAAGRL